MKIKQGIQLLEKITGKKFRLVEANEASKNLAVNTLKALSDSLDLVANNIVDAMDQIDELPDNDVMITKLKGMESVIQAALTDTAEMITTITGLQTTQNIMEPDLEESFNPNEGSIEMSMTDATNNPDKVKKVLDKGINVKVDDPKFNDGASYASYSTY